jgi:hypothetical protein
MKEKAEIPVSLTPEQRELERRRLQRRWWHVCFNQT